MGFPSGTVTLLFTDVEDSIRLWEAALAVSRAAGDNYRLAITLANLGIYELAAGELREARAHLQEASALADHFGYPNVSVGLRENLGFVDLIDADPGKARSLFLDGLDAARLIGVKSYYVHAALLGLALATAAARADPEVAAASTIPATGQAITDGSAGPLSEREREILALVAGGATDAQIAERLYLSTNTVRSHLERIRDKTGARRRAELVRYAIQAGIESADPSA